MDVAVDEAALPADYHQGNLAWRRGDYATAEARYRSALALCDHPDVRRDLGNVLLAQAKDAEGWRLYEARPSRRKALDWPLSFPEWRGQSLAGKRLLVRPEQGFGDQILAARYIPNLGAAQVTVYCVAPLVRIMSQLCADVREIGAEAQAIGRYDYWTLPLSLPCFAEPTAAPYLTGKARVSGGIGVAWRGNHLPDPARSMSDAEALPLLSLAGATSLHPEDSGARDFQDTADIIAGLDLVISVDTSIAHLAGAMGKPVWVLLHSESREWRWREVAPFYPSASLFEQARRGDWNEVVSRVCARVR